MVREDVFENLAFDTAPKKDRRESGMHVRGRGLGGGWGVRGGFQITEALQEVPNMFTGVKKKNNKSTSMYVFIQKKEKMKIFYSVFLV